MPVSTKAISSVSRVRGCLLGLATGDALGTTLEFRAPGTFKPISDLVGGGPFDLKPGQWTDDTSMALCLAESLLERRGFEPVDQLERYVRWWRQGYLSSTGTCFDIGNTVRGALEQFEATGEPWCGPTHPRSAGNGSLMRLAPVGIANFMDPERAIALGGESSRTTHGAKEAVDACRHFAGLLVGAIRGIEKEELLSGHYSPVEGLWRREPLTPAIDAIAGGSFKNRAPPNICGMGYVVACLEAALWAFHTTSTFEEGALAAVNLGDDADTTGAVYGQFAVAYYGEENIPGRWREQLAMHSRIVELADGLYLAATAPASVENDEGDAV